MKWFIAVAVLFVASVLSDCYQGDECYRSCFPRGVKVCALTHVECFDVDKSSLQENDAGRPADTKAHESEK